MRICFPKTSGMTFSFRHLITVMCLILLALSAYSVSYMHRRQRREMLEREIDSCTEALQTFTVDSDFSIREFESFLFETFSDNSDLNAFQYGMDTAESYQAKSNILKLLRQSIRLNGSIQGAFCILSDPRELLYLARYQDNTVSAKDSEEIKKDILFLVDNNGAEKRRPWYSCTLNNKHCMIWMVRTGEAICGAWFFCDSYLEKCLKYLGADNITSLKLIGNGSVLGHIAPNEPVHAENDARKEEQPCGMEGMDAQEMEKETGLGQVIIEVELPRLGISVVLQMTQDSLLSKRQISFDYVWYTATLLLVILGIVVIFQLFMYRPILKLSANVRSISENEEANPIREDYKMREISDLSKYINQSLNKIRTMKISNYETRLSELQMAQEFLLMRHKTHFFINCISVIHALAIERNYEFISKMAVSLTDYLRKIDYENQEYVRLDDELRLIHSYIQIQEIRFGDSFRYVEDVPIDLFEAAIPPLILQTFVENAVEHGRVHEKDNLICLKIGFSPEEEGNMLVIDIIDNGTGFPDDFRMEYGNSQKTDRLSQGHGVGISNAIARLHYIYNNRAIIDISNEPGGGAHIRMKLPILD